METRIAAFWIVVGSMMLLLRVLSTNPILRAAFTWFVPKQLSNEKWSTYQFRMAAYSSSWLIQFLFLFSVLWLVSRLWPAAVESKWWPVFLLGLPLGIGTSALAAIGYVIKGVKARYSGRDNTIDDWKGLASNDDDLTPLQSPLYAGDTGTGDLLLSQLLAGKDVIEAFGQCENCVVVDWRDGLPEILEELTPHLPNGYLRVEQVGDMEYSLQAGDRAPRTLVPPSKTEDLLVELNRVLLPDFELRQFTPCDGDGYSLYLAPPSVWNSIEHSHPKEVARFFLSVERLAAYWRKGFFSRVFSKR